MFTIQQLILLPIYILFHIVTLYKICYQILPAIKAKWPDVMSKDILIQQDNCPAHINDDDPDFRAAASADGFNIHLFSQPANSPDTNVNDLGYFRALQSLKDEETPPTRAFYSSNLED